MLFITTLIRSRDPMFTFAFDDVLFKFQYDRPAFAPLFQFPPNRASTHSISLSFKLKAGGVPPDPPKELF